MCVCVRGRGQKCSRVTAVTNCLQRGANVFLLSAYRCNGDPLSDVSLRGQTVVNERDSHSHITHRETKPSQDYKASLGGNVLPTRCVDIWKLYDWWLAAKKGMAGL